MFLTYLNSQTEKEYFISLAYLLAKADGSLDYPEKLLIDLYIKELQLNPLDNHLQNHSLFNLCHFFADSQYKQIIFANLLFITLITNYESQQKKDLLQKIRRELAIDSDIQQKYEDEFNIFQGHYFPSYID